MARKFELNTVDQYDLSQGIDYIPAKKGLESATKSIQHGVIEDLLITGNGLNQLPVASKELVEMLNLYGKGYLIQGSITIENKTLNVTEKGKEWNHWDNDVKATISTVYRPVRYKYECNSRQIFKPLNDLCKSIKATEKISKVIPSTDNTSRDLTDHMLLLALAFNDTQKAMSYLRKYNADRIEYKINKQFFKHVYKLLHPDTVITELK